MKIPNECNLCGEPLSLTDMSSWVEACEKHGFEPVAHAMRTTSLAGIPRTPGVTCLTCFARVVGDAAEDGHSDAVALIRDRPKDE